MAVQPLEIPRLVAGLSRQRQAGRQTGRQGYRQSRVGGVWLTRPPNQHPHSLTHTHTAMVTGRQLKVLMLLFSFRPVKPRARLAAAVKIM